MIALGVHALEHLADLAAELVDALRDALTR